MGIYRRWNWNLIAAPPRGLHRRLIELDNTPTYVLSSPLQAAARVIDVIVVAVGLA